jgi:hypothetical protein
MTINRDLTALIIPQPAARGGLAETEPRPKIGVRVGIATKAAAEAAEAAQASVFREVITVYSVIVLTADGAFERPPGWPSDGTYTGTGFELDPAEPYYEQKRVHAVFYDAGTGLLYEDNYLITLEPPYASVGSVNTLLNVPTNIVLRKTVLAYGLSAPMINAKADELTAMGII